LKFLSGGLLLVSNRNDLFGGILHTVGDGEVKTRIAQYALPLLDVRTFEADDNRGLNADVLGGVDHAARDHVAADDSAEDVDEYSPHVLVGEEDAEGRLDALLRNGGSLFVTI